MSEIYIYGSGGHGAIVAEIAAILGYQVLGFIDDNPERKGQSVLEWRVLGGPETIPEGAQVALGIGDNATRAALLETAEARSWSLPVLVHPSAIISPSAVLGAGTVIAAQCAVTARATIGRGCILNTACSVDHDCAIGDAVHIAPGVHLSGNVTLGDQVLVGVGSCIRPGITIGPRCTVGAGAAVVSHFPAGVTVYGNPARLRIKAHAPDTLVGLRYKTGVTAMSTATQAPITYPIICPTLPDESELREELRAVFESGRVTVGGNVMQLEDDVCRRTGAKHTIAVSSGTSGLMLLLRALNLPAGSEVITPSFTFAATSHALLWLGLKPVFCDSEPGSFTMDPAAAEALINERTSAIYPVCIFGVPGDLDAYQRLAEKHGLALLYDSAQGLGSTYKGRGIGSFGAGEAFSMSPTKVVTAMEGGLVTTNDDSLAEQLRYMRDYGKAPDGEDMRWLGLSARMAEVNALVARWSLARIDTWVHNRTAISARYQERLNAIPGVSFQQIPDCCSSSRNYTVILLDPDASPITRDELYKHLKEDGIQTKRYFYPALHNQTLFKDIEPGCSARLPVAERISSRSLALPMYSHMSLDLVDHICDRILAHAGR